MNVLNNLECRVLIHSPGEEPWERELFANKFRTLSAAEFDAFCEGYNFAKYAIDITEYKPPFHIAKFKGKEIVDGDKIFGPWVNNKRKNLVFVPDSSNINLGGGKNFVGFCVIEEDLIISVGGLPNWISRSFRTRLKGDLEKLTINNLLL